MRSYFMRTSHLGFGTWAPDDLGLAMGLWGDARVTRLIGGEQWVEGFATEAASAVINYSFATLGAVALVAGHHPQNEASRHVLQRLGFRFTHDEFCAPTGLDHPSYALAAGETAPGSSGAAGLRRTARNQRWQACAGTG